MALTTTSLLSLTEGTTILSNNPYGDEYVLRTTNTPTLCGPCGEVRVARALVLSEAPYWSVASGTVCPLCGDRTGVARSTFLTLS